ncbi:MAG: phage portal protein [Verrucomicrobiaceae bacterium]|nr:MAG: phage portal protein [Verrucomicrobiaceae bacterium]
MTLIPKLARFVVPAAFLPKAWASPYDAANWSHSRGRVPGSAPRDAKLDLSPGVRTELVRRSRYLHRNSGFVREMVSNMAIYSTGDGIRPQAQSTDPDWNRRAEEIFRRWSAQCEVTNRFSFEECQSLVCRGMDVDGEFFVLKTRDRSGLPRIQLIETHRIGDDSAETCDGVGLAPDGSPTFYRLIEDSGPRDIPAASMLHIFEPESVSAVRNAPTIQHSINHMIDEMELLALEKHAVKDNADVARILKTARGEIEDTGDFSIGAQAIQPQASDAAQLQKIIGGKLVALKPDESLDSFQSNRPSPTFTGFLQHLRRDSALGVLPFEFAADSSKIGGAGVRLVVAKADRRFSYRQLILINRLIEPVWAYVIGDAIARGELAAQPQWWRISCTTPKRVSVDAGRESQQNRADVEMGLKTISQSYGELGLDFEEEMRVRARNARFLVDLAAEFQIPLEMLWKTSGGIATTTAVGELQDPPQISGMRQPG